MSADVLTEAEEMFIAAPLPLSVDETPCDVYGCDAMAHWLIPGAALCFACAAEYGIGRTGYLIPCNELVGGEQWREAREADYLERLRALRLIAPRVRDERAEAALEMLAELALFGRD